MPLRHEVKQGECLSNIARKYGFRDWKLIYNHSINSGFRKRRPNPNVIFPGDVVLIPDKKAQTRDVATGKVHTFRVPSQKRVLRLRFTNSDGTPASNQATTLVPKAKPPVTGKKTDTDGRVEFLVGPEDSEATLKIGSRDLLLDLSHLNPIDDTPDDGLSGIQARLLNLGYYNHPLTDELDLPTRIALSIFQHDAQLDITGRPDKTTVTKLIQAYGC